MAVFLFSFEYSGYSYTSPSTGVDVAFLFSFEYSSCSCKELLPEELYFLFSFEYSSNRSIGRDRT